MVILGRIEFQLREDAPHMTLDGFFAETQRTRYRRVGTTFGHELQDVPLALGEIGYEVALAPADDELRDDLGVDGRAATAHTAHRLGELVHIRNAVLEQIADPASPVLEQAQRMSGLDVLGEEQDRDLGVPFSDQRGGLEPFGRVRRRHADVRDSNVRPLLLDEREQLWAIAGATHNLMSRSVEEPSKAFAK